MSDYFCIFTKKGILVHEHGLCPPYRNNLIVTLNTQKTNQSRAIQDSFMFCRMIHDTVYLAIMKHRSEDIFNNMISKYNSDSQHNANEFSSESIDVDQNGDGKEFDINVSNKEAISDQKMTDIEVNNTKVCDSVKSKSTKKSAIDRIKAKGKQINEKKEAKDIKTKTDKQRKWDVVEEDPSLDFSVKGDSFNKAITIKKEENKKNYSFNLFSKFIKKTDLREKMENHLINKNLSVEITKQLIEDVLSELPENVNEKEFKAKLKEVVKRMIKSIDHEELIKEINKKKEIFVFCFVGVNGVGKSTTLAKICCWLLQKHLKVYIAACDTFRAGAVEQLKVHVDAFQRGGHDVGFYERGYNKDDAGVAKNAIKIAEKEGYDVILIDTAGRMHNKKNLMESLSKLIRVNDIDHIIFVGEALVGNDSLEHLKEFNNAIKYGNEQKCIDSIFVSKVDTVDDKIGQVVNMSVGGECPVLFLGTGQTNSSLTVLNSENVVDLLMN
ncbi:hypothetical protein COBT_001527 [Conglomerata obtusa]